MSDSLIVQAFAHGDPASGWQWVLVYWALLVFASFPRAPFIGGIENNDAKLTRPHGHFWLLWALNIKLEIWTLDPHSEKLDPNGQIEDMLQYKQAAIKLRNHLAVHGIARNGGCHVLSFSAIFNHHLYSRRPAPKLFPQSGPNRRKYNQTGHKPHPHRSCWFSTSLLRRLNNPWVSLRVAPLYSPLEPVHECIVTQIGSGFTQTASTAHGRDDADPLDVS